MDIEVDIIDFKVPIENNKTIFVWDIQPIFSEAYIYVSVLCCVILLDGQSYTFHNIQVRLHLNFGQKMYISNMFA